MHFLCPRQKREAPGSGGVTSWAFSKRKHTPFLTRLAQFLGQSPSQHSTVGSPDSDISVVVATDGNGGNGAAAGTVGNGVSSAAASTPSSPVIAMGSSVPSESCPQCHKHRLREINPSATLSLPIVRSYMHRNGPRPAVSGPMVGPNRVCDFCWSMSYSGHNVTAGGPAPMTAGSRATAPIVRKGRGLAGLFSSIGGSRLGRDGAAANNAMVVQCAPEMFSNHAEWAAVATSGAAPGASKGSPVTSRNAASPLAGGGGAGQASDGSESGC